MVNIFLRVSLAVKLEVFGGILRRMFCNSAKNRYPIGANFDNWLQGLRTQLKAIKLKNQKLYVERLTEKNIRM